MMERVGRISLGDWIPVMGSGGGRSTGRRLGKLAMGRDASICLVTWENWIWDRPARFCR